jgi:hypothetical protein
MNSVIDIEKLEEKARIVEAASKLNWLPVPVAAVYGNMSVTKVWHLIKTKELAFSKDDGQIVIKRQDVDKYWVDRRRSLE